MAANNATIPILLLLSSDHPYSCNSNLVMLIMTQPIGTIPSPKRTFYTKTSLCVQALGTRTSMHSQMESPSFYQYCDGSPNQKDFSGPNECPGFPLISYAIILHERHEFFLDLSKELEAELGFSAHAFPQNKSPQLLSTFPIKSSDLPLSCRFALTLKWREQCL